MKIQDKIDQLKSEITFYNKLLEAIPDIEINEYDYIVDYNIVDCKLLSSTIVPNDFKVYYYGVPINISFYKQTTFLEQEIQIFVDNKTIPLVDYNYHDMMATIADYRSLKDFYKIDNKLMSKLDLFVIKYITDNNLKIKTCPDYIKKLLVFS